MKAIDVASGVGDPIRVPEIVFYQILLEYFKLLLKNLIFGGPNGFERHFLLLEISAQNFETLSKKIFLSQEKIVVLCVTLSIARNGKYIPSALPAGQKYQHYQ